MFLDIIMTGLSFQIVNFFQFLSDTLGHNQSIDTHFSTTLSSDHPLGDKHKSYSKIGCMFKSKLSYYLDSLDLK